MNLRAINIIPKENETLNKIHIIKKDILNRKYMLTTNNEINIQNFVIVTILPLTIRRELYGELRAFIIITENIVKNITLSGIPS